MTNKLSLIARVTIDILSDTAVSTAIDVAFRGAEFGDSFRRNLVAGAFGTALGEAGGRLIGAGIKRAQAVGRWLRGAADTAGSSFGPIHADFEQAEALVDGWRIRAMDEGWADARMSLDGDATVPPYRVEPRRFDHSDYGLTTRLDVYSTVNGNHLASFQLAEEYGALSMYLRTKDISTTPPTDWTGANVSGQAIFNDLWNRLGGERKINLIEGIWDADPAELSSNFRRFEEGLADGLSLQQAALRTYPGGYAVSKGFTDVTVHTYVPGKSAKIFFRPTVP